jgi:hypothetical protein
MTRLLAVPAHRRAILRGALVGGILGRLAAPGSVSAVPQVAGVCDVDGDGVIDTFDNPRFAESFTAAVSGKLSEIQIRIDKTAGTTGDFVVQLRAADPVSGEPTKVLASKRVANGSVAEGEKVIVQARFKKRNTIKLVQDKRYAVVISRPHGSGDHAGFAARFAVDNPCDGDSFFFSEQQSGPFTPGQVNTDMPFAVLVGF